MLNQNKIVISASRRTDLVGCYPEVFINKLENFPPDKVHTIVIWTKNPLNIIENSKLNKKLREYNNIYIHLTITGMGGSDLEPGIPNSDEIFKMMPDLIKFVGTSEKISWRFDPIIRLKKNGQDFTNLVYFDNLLEKIASFDIKQCRISWVYPYKKVNRNLDKYGFELILPIYSDMRKDYDYILMTLKEKNMEIAVCAIEEFPISRCIDGNLLSKLHPQKLLCSFKRAKAQRKFCGCTESIDIGFYALKCLHGCIYCYANPKV